MFGLEIVIGGAVFWLLIAAFFIATEITVAQESNLGVVWLTLLVLTLAVISPFNLFVWIWYHLITTAWIVAVYLVSGAIWGFVKWYFYVLNSRDYVKTNETRLRAGWSTSSQNAKPFTNYLIEHNYIPQAKEKKSLISVWMFWWPFSIFWTVFNDIIRRGYNWVITKYITVFQRINNHVFKGFDK